MWNGSRGCSRPPATKMSSFRPTAFGWNPTWRFTPLALAFEADSTAKCTVGRQCDDSGEHVVAIASVMLVGWNEIDQGIVLCGVTKSLPLQVSPHPAEHSALLHQPLYALCRLVLAFRRPAQPGGGPGSVCSRKDPPDEGPADGLQPAFGEADGPQHVKIGDSPFLRYFANSRQVVQNAVLDYLGDAFSDDLGRFWTTFRGNANH